MTITKEQVVSMWHDCNQDIHAFARCVADHALEEAAKACDAHIHYGEVSGLICAKAIREMKGTK